MGCGSSKKKEEEKRKRKERKRRKKIQLEQVALAGREFAEVLEQERSPPADNGSTSEITVAQLPAPSPVHAVISPPQMDLYLPVSKYIPSPQCLRRPYHYQPHPQTMQQPQPEQQWQSTPPENFPPPPAPVYSNPNPYYYQKAAAYFPSSSQSYSEPSIPSQYDLGKFKTAIANTSASERLKVMLGSVVQLRAGKVATAAADREDSTKLEGSSASDSALIFSASSSKQDSATVSAAKSSQETSEGSSSDKVVTVVKRAPPPFPPSPPVEVFRATETKWEPPEAAAAKDDKPEESQSSGEKSTADKSTRSIKSIVSQKSEQNKKLDMLVGQLMQLDQKVANLRSTRRQSKSPEKAASTGESSTGKKVLKPKEQGHGDQA